MTQRRRHPNVVHQDEITPVTIAKGDHRIERRRFTEAANNQRLGGSLMTIPPGSIGYPHHYHCGNEEAIYVLSGAGVARIGEARVAIRAGDWIAYPTGAEHAHQMINDGEAPLVYLAISTAVDCDVIGYPDSNKLAAWAEGEWRGMRLGESVDYWDGEPNT